jgi:hypothetical protein
LVAYVSLLLPTDELTGMVRSGSRFAPTDAHETCVLTWLAAAHDRYMELTGNNGFTRGSPRALIPFYGYETGPSGIAVETLSECTFPPLVHRLTRRTIDALGDGANDRLTTTGSLVAVARKPCRA